MIPDRHNSDHLAHRDGDTYAGTHLIADIHGGRGLDDLKTIETVLRDCVKACGATLLHLHVHRFAPQGITGIALLAESHMSLHTWPEANFAAFDAFMCGDNDPRQAIEILETALCPAKIQVQELFRGQKPV